MSAKPTPHSSAPLFTLGDTVRKRVNRESTGIVTGLVYRPNNLVQFLVSWGEPNEETVHYDIELISGDDCVESVN